MKTKLGIILSMFLLALGFQNCSKAVEFSTGSLVSKGDSISNDIGNGNLDNYTDVTTPDDNIIIDDNTSDNSNLNGDVITSDDSPTIDDNTTDDPNSNEESDISKPSDHGYVCIIEGPGNSQKIGYVNGALLGKNATPQDVCMSERACNEIISQKIIVKGPAARGFCPNKNPHVVEMSDEQVQALVDAL